MSTASRSATKHYASAQTLQDSVGMYLKMFETLLKLNRQGLRLHEKKDYEAEFSTFEDVARIVMSMTGLYEDCKTEEEKQMHRFFKKTMHTALSYAAFEDRCGYYQVMYDLVYGQYETWKKLTGRL